MVVDVPRLDEQPLSHLADLRVKPGHQPVEGLDERDLEKGVCTQPLGSWVV